MNTDIPDDDQTGETYQVGVTVVQAFTVSAIPVTPGMALEPRLGRPARNRTADTLESLNNPAIPLPPAEPKDGGK